LGLKSQPGASFASQFVVQSIDGVEEATYHNLGQLLSLHKVSEGWIDVHLLEAGEEVR
jgi:hypothetical protein